MAFVIAYETILYLKPPLQPEGSLLEAPASVQEVAEAAVEGHSEEAVKKGALIHDFCFGIPYGMCPFTLMQ
jgi:hypothetical protein